MVTAGPITYNIDFTTNAGITPASGRFTYDETGPMDTRFTAFSVNWNGVLFDLTDAANHPAIFGTQCGTTSNAATSFAFFVGPGICANSQARFWAATGLPLLRNAEFSFGESDLELGTSIQIISRDPADAGPGEVSYGGFSIVPVPEPSALVLAFMGCAFLLGTWGFRRD